MNGRTHLLFGTVTAVTLTVMTKGSDISQTDLIFIAGSMAGSLIPDIDTRNSIAGKVLFLPSYFISRLGHRTYTHDIVLMGIISIILFLKFPLSAGFIFGYMGHLLLDACTRTGIPWLYFFHRKKAQELDRKHIYSNRRFDEGYIHILPKPIRMKSSGIPAVLFTILCTIIFGFGLYYLKGFGML